MKGKLPADADIDLGLAISALTLRYGECRTQDEIAAYCGCSRQQICNIENRAIRKLRRSFFWRKEPELMELFEQVLHRKPREPLYSVNIPGKNGIRR